MMKRVLNVGGHSHDIELPEIYRDWQHHLLDIDPKGQPDILCDARKLTSLEGHQYDAIYCSHNLEHYNDHEVDQVLHGFVHLLEPKAGFAHIRVPDLLAVFAVMQQRNLDLDDVLYQTAAGLPIKVLDVIYGWGQQIERSGADFYAHKTGFSEKRLVDRLQQNGFPWVMAARDRARLEIVAFAFIHQPSAELSQALELPLVP